MIDPILKKKKNLRIVPKMAEVQTSFLSNSCRYQKRTVVLPIRKSTGLRMDYPKLSPCFLLREVVFLFVVVLFPLFPTAAAHG